MEPVHWAQAPVFLFTHGLSKAEFYHLLFIFSCYLSHFPYPSHHLSDLVPNHSWLFAKLIAKIFNRLPYATCFTAVTVTKCQNEAFGSGSAYDLLNSSNCHKMMQSRSPADFFTIGFKAFSVVKCCNTVLGTAIFYDLFCSRNCHKISQCGSCVALFRTYYVRGTVAKCCNAAFKADSAL